MTMMPVERDEIGIHGIELYFPDSYIEQSELEVHDGVSSGKYTIGLGQQRMAFCSPAEDAVSMCLTVFDRLLRRHNLNSEMIGRIDVGSESNPDRAKSIRSHLLSLLHADRGNAHLSVSGSDCVQACYGGTAALLNATAWLESSQWDGRWAVVVAGDVAVYAPGPARATGGSGAMALLLGRHKARSSSPAPIISFPCDPRTMGHASCHTYDFYKPNPYSEYPLVDGPLSIAAYTSAALHAFKDRCRRRGSCISEGVLVGLDRILFHSPYSKIVQKTCWLLANAKEAESQELSSLSSEEKQFAEAIFVKKVSPGLQFSRQLGNMYCASLYCNLVSVLIDELSSLSDESELTSRLGLFSYGSGSMATVFELTLHRDRMRHCAWLLELAQEIKHAFSHRKRAAPQDYEQLMLERVKAYGQAPWKPKDEHVATVASGCFYLTGIDEAYRRSYRRKRHVDGLLEE